MTREMLVCDACGMQGVPMPPDFMKEGCKLPDCVLCGSEQAEMDQMRVGWDDA